MLRRSQVDVVELCDNRVGACPGTLETPGTLSAVPEPVESCTAVELISRMSLTQSAVSNSE
ncbi:MAG: hypothetical protein J07HX64_01416 [halophilic archaeon J07HX64]|nr:MAG: hypothetical protein J07HX64_01416 [halophilic archaeon J07HX64]